LVASDDQRVLTDAAEKELKQGLAHLADRIVDIAAEESKVPGVRVVEVTASDIARVLDRVGMRSRVGRYPMTRLVAWLYTILGSALFVVSVTWPYAREYVGQMDVMSRMMAVAGLMTAVVGIAFQFYTRVREGRMQALGRELEASATKRGYAPATHSADGPPHDGVGPPGGE
jgi:hypothetical protein